MMDMSLVTSAESEEPSTVDGLSLGLDRADKLLGQRDVGLDHMTRGAANLANLIGHALQVKVDVDDRLQQAEVEATGTGGNQVVADGLRLAQRASIESVRFLVLVASLRSSVIGLHGIMEGQIDGLVDAQHLVTGLDELTGKQFAHGSPQSVGWSCRRTVNTHRTRSDRLGTSRTDQQSGR